MHRIVLSLAAALALSAAAAFADPVPSPEVTPQSAPAPANVATPDVHDDGDTIVCKWTTIVGSRFPERLCLSKRRWAKMHDASQNFMRDMEQRSSGGQERGM